MIIETDLGDVNLKRQNRDTEWHYRIGDGIFSGDRRIASLSYKGKPISQRIDYDELTRNAHLFLAAPALLAACRRLLDSEREQSEGIRSQAVAMARVAVSDALGKDV